MNSTSEIERQKEAAIDALRLKAFETNSDADRQAYFDAVSKWFQDRHIRRVNAERVPFLPVQGAVKKLDWHKNSSSSVWTGELIFRTYYTIDEEENGFRVWRGQFLSDAGADEVAFAATLEAAKAAAQADYSARILSALEPSAARELALEEAAQVAEMFPECDLLNVNGNEVSPAVNDAFKRGAFAQGKAIAAAIRALSSPDHADAGKVEGDGIERAKFYHHQWPMDRLLAARRDGLVDHSGGEAWRYEYSHKDEHGKYDILYRPVKNTTIPARLPSAPASEGAE
ncbi:hypothetical protein N7376_24560 [Brucella intermedia GD04153]|uniref:Uncharacterized protein n=1 Tax=Brucella intermedia GD04153 TaxID=2975438 RepID=A0AA42H1V5_9HYPH|nr:hypothetical protein [Brucella intermedia]MDH0127143.1 hypothetical protein [Brucella intermedia GD04153]